MTRQADRALTWGDFAWLIAVVALGFIVRIKLLLDTNSVIDGDEGIVGLMAMHIVAGEPWPIFYYGQAYMGSLEPILVAGLFSLFGISSVALKMVPLYFSLLLIVAVYSLARLFTDRFGAAVAALFAAFPPSALTLWSLMARGGFIELVFIGTLSLILAVRILTISKPHPRAFLFLGLLLGLGWWVNNQIIFYLVPIGITFAVHFVRRDGVSRAVLLGLITLLGFFVGGAPFWYVNLCEEPLFQSFFLFERASFSDQVQYLRGFFSEALPIILGARRFWSNEDLFPGSTLLVFLLYMLAIIAFAAEWISPKNRTSDDEFGSLSSPPPFGLLLLFLILVPLIFASSKFGWLSQAPRYLLPMYPVLFVVVGSAVSSLRSSRYWGTNALSFALTGLLVVVNFASNYANGGAIPGEPMVFRQQRVAHDHAELYAWLRENNYNHIHTNYWIGYRVAFETAEAVTFTLFEGPQQLRIPEYPRLREREDLGVFILVPAEAHLIARGFADLGLKFRMTQVGEYIALDHVVPAIALGEEVPLSEDQIVVPSRDSWKGQLIDGDLGTRWGSGEPQVGGMTVSVVFTKPTAIVGFQIDYGFWPQDMARDLTVEAVIRNENGEQSHCVLADTRGDLGLKHVIDGMETWRFVFPPVEVVELRLIQQGYDSVFDWSMAELSLFGPRRLGTDEDSVGLPDGYEFEVGENEYGL